MNKQSGVRSEEWGVRREEAQRVKLCFLVSTLDPGYKRKKGVSLSF